MVLVSLRQDTRGQDTRVEEWRLGTLHITWNPHCGGRSGQPWPSTALRCVALPETAWREITIAAGSQGPRTYRYRAQRVRVTSRHQPGEFLRVVIARTRTAANAVTICPTLPRTPGWRPSPTWVVPGDASKPSSRPRTAACGWRVRSPCLGGLASSRTMALSYCHAPAGRGFSAGPAAGWGNRCP